MILLIDNYDSFSYNLVQLAGSLRQDVKVVRNDVLTVEEVEERLKTPVQIIDEPGSDLVKAVVEENQETIHRRRTMYEQADCSNCGPAERG